MLFFSDELKEIFKNTEINNKNKIIEIEDIFFSILNKNKKIFDLFSSIIIKKSTKKIYSNYKEYSLELKQIIEEAFINAKKNNEKYLTTETLLKTIISNNNTITKQLNQQNIDINNIIKSLSYLNEKELLIYQLGVNLNSLVKCNEIKPVYGRKDEINNIIQILAKKNKCNPLLIGKPGVGKTALVETLAYNIVNKDVPEFLLNKEIISLNLATLLSGTKYRGEFEEKLTQIIKEVENNENIIIFIDEIHMLVKAGGSEGAIDASNILKPTLARNKFKLIGATTIEEYEKTIEKDKALNRRLQKILITEPNKNETYKILANCKKYYEDFHKVNISNEQLKTIVNLASVYLPNKSEPDRSMDILDELCAKTKINKKNNYEKTKEKIKKIENEKLINIRNQNYEKAIILKDKINSLKHKLNNTKTDKNVSNDIIKEIFESKSNNKISKPNITKTLNYLKEKNLNIKEENIKKFLNYTNQTNKIIIKTKNYKLIKNYCKFINSNLIIIDGKDYKNETDIEKLIGTKYPDIKIQNTLLSKLKNNINSTILVNNTEFINRKIFNFIENCIASKSITNPLNEKISLNNTLFIYNITDQKNKIGFITNNKTEKILTL